MKRAVGGRGDATFAALLVPTAVAALAACSNVDLYRASLAEARGDYDAAFALLSEPAADDVPMAKVRLAALYAQGQGVERDLERARALLTESLDAGIGETWPQAYLALAHLQLDPSQDDPAGALANLKKAFDEGVDEAALLIGELRWRGERVPADRAIAERWLALARSRSVAGAYATRAALALEGRHEEPDLAQALAWYEAGIARDETASILGYSELASDRNGPAYDLEAALRVLEEAYEKRPRGSLAQRLGDLHSSALLAAYDPVVAERWYRRALERGQPTAAVRLAALYRNGPAEMRDPDHAQRLVARAEASGEPAALAELGQAYRQGEGVPRDADKAKRLLERAAYKGNADAALRLAQMHGAGDGVPVDAAEAMRWYRAADALGHPAAAGDLGRLLASELPSPLRDPEAAEQWLIRGAARGDAAAAFRLGEMARLGVQSNLGAARAIRHYERAFELGQGFGAIRIGTMYRLGKGVARDPVKAAAWYRKAAERGTPTGRRLLADMLIESGTEGSVEEALALYSAENDGTALFQLGKLYRDGGHVTPDRAGARRLFEQAVEKGQPFAALELGDMLAHGQGGAVDLEEAERWYRLAADGDIAAGYRELAALALRRGDGPEAEAEAADHLTNAARLGDRIAALRLAEAYRRGRGVPRDEARALEAYRQGDAWNNGYAALRVGGLYLDGGAVPKDTGEARRWLERATALGKTRAYAHLGHLYLREDFPERNARKAARLFARAPQDGGALLALGDLYAQGLGVEQDTQRALDLYRRAYDRGQSYGALRLAEHYARTTDAVAQARHWYDLAAEAGHAPAVERLASEDQLRRRLEGFDILPVADERAAMHPLDADSPSLIPERRHEG